MLDKRNISRNENDT